MPLNSIFIQNICGLLADYRKPWWVAGGWAVDMHCGRQTREHSDLEIAIPRTDQHAIRQSLGADLDWRFSREKQLHPWKNQIELLPPVHEIHVQTKSGPVEILLNEFDEDGWIYRRDNRIHLDKELFCFEPPSPLPCEVLLLFKSKHLRPKDNADFAELISIMSLHQKTWLKKAIELNDTTHPWLSAL